MVYYNMIVWLYW